MPIAKGVLERNSHFIMITFLIVIDVGLTQMIIEGVIEVTYTSIFHPSNPNRYELNSRMLAGFLMVKSAFLYIIAFIAVQSLPDM